MYLTNYLDFLPELFLPVLFRGTFAPFLRASESPIAIACFRLFTFRPLPDLSVPFLRRRIALATRFCAAGPYFLLPEDFFAAILVPPWGEMRPIRDPLAHVVPSYSVLYLGAGFLHVALP